MRCLCENSYHIQENAGAEDVESVEGFDVDDKAENCGSVDVDDSMKTTSSLRPPAAPEPTNFVSDTLNRIAALATFLL